ncbi:hypothetical protein AMPC_38990 [Anaeromyxobacter paludicola]|uniref:Uncharacterized protein n=1 Tax=Anaeromyxobacter paludicola TaxID=2918171 RepID=A0ABN6NE55_9BACT|nr:hypothetical protein AMPC_38990 [Anaeromyxobacter paludicola]
MPSPLLPVPKLDRSDTVDTPAVPLLHEDDRAIGTLRSGELDATRERPASRTDRRDGARDGDVLEPAPRVLAALHQTDRPILDERDEHLGLDSGRPARRHLQLRPGARHDARRHFAPRLARGGLDGGSRALFLAPDEVDRTADHQLRRVDASRREPARVSLLPPREGPGREGIAPSEPVPVVHVLRERDDPHTGDRLVAKQAAQGSVCRRTGRAPFRGEELDEHRHARGVRRSDGAGQRRRDRGDQPLPGQAPCARSRTGLGAAHAEVAHTVEYAERSAPLQHPSSRGSEEEHR